MKLNLLLGFAAGVGVVATAITSHYCTLSAEKVLKKYNNLCEDKWTRTKQKFELVWKNYIPVFLVGTITIGCVFGSIHAGRRAMLAAGAGASYVVANKDKLEEKANRFVQEMGKRLREQEPNDLQTIELTGNGDLLCYEAYSGRWFRSSREAVEDAIRRFNQDFENYDYVNLNTLYNHLSIMPTNFGSQFGYVNNPDYYDGKIDIFTEYVPDGDIQFEDWLGSIVISRNEPVLCINIGTYPMECYLEV